MDEEEIESLRMKKLQYIIEENIQFRRKLLKAKKRAAEEEAYENNSPRTKILKRKTTRLIGMTN